MEPEGSLPYSQVPATCLYPELLPTTPSNFLKIHLNIILPSTSGSPQRPLSLRFPHQHPVHPSLLTHTHYMPCPSHSSRLCCYYNWIKFKVPNFYLYTWLISSYIFDFTLGQCSCFIILGVYIIIVVFRQILSHTAWTRQLCITWCHHMYDPIH
jgi:hypothetical protein